MRINDKDLKGKSVPQSIQDKNKFSGTRFTPEGRKKAGFVITAIAAVTFGLGSLFGIVNKGDEANINMQSAQAQPKQHVLAQEEVSSKDFVQAQKFVDNFKQVIYQKTSKLMKIENLSKINDENIYISDKQFDKGLKNFVKYLIEHEKIRDVPNSALDMMTASQSNKYDMLEGTTRWEIRKIILDNINAYYDFVSHNCKQTIDTTNLIKLFSEGNIMIITDYGQAIFSLYEGKVIGHWNK